MAQNPAETGRIQSSASVHRNDLIPFLAGFAENFTGKAIDARWQTAVVLTGVAAALQNSSPPRVLFDTGATIGSSSELNENAIRKWAIAQRFSIALRVKLNQITTVLHFPLIMDNSANERIQLRYDTSAAHIGWNLMTTAGGVTTTTSLGLVADTNWHWLFLSCQPGSVKGRIDSLAPVENTTNLTASDMQIRTGIANGAAVQRTCELSNIMTYTGLALF